MQIFGGASTVPVRAKTILSLAQSALIGLTIAHWSPPAVAAPDSTQDGNGVPIADAGPDQTAAVGQTAYLDGSRSSDADGDPLTYSWILVAAPHDSWATLSEPNSVFPSVFIDVRGRYQFELVVDDGQSSSVPDTVIIGTVNSAPKADAGSDVTVGVAGPVWA